MRRSLLVLLAACCFCSSAPAADTRSNLVIYASTYLEDFYDEMMGFFYDPYPDCGAPGEPCEYPRPYVPPSDGCDGESDCVDWGDMFAPQCPSDSYCG
jgi:hypothetical protein